MALTPGATVTIEAKVLHVVDLGGGVLNYCLELPSGRTTWLRSYAVDESSEAKHEPTPPATKAVPSPPTAKAAPAKKARPRKAAGS